MTQGKEKPVRDLQTAVTGFVSRLVTAQQAVREGLYFWGRNLLDEQSGLGELHTNLDAVKVFLESLQAYSSPGRLKNFRYDREDVEAQHAGLNALRELESLGELAAALGSAASFLSAAEAVLPPDHEWVARMKDARATLLGQIADPVGTLAGRVPPRHAAGARRSESSSTSVSTSTCIREPDSASTTTRASAGFSTTTA